LPSHHRRCAVDRVLFIAHKMHCLDVKQECGPLRMLEV
jgi:hypothetical protein